MTAAGLHHDPEVLAAASAALLRLRERSASLRYAAVLTDDGFEVQSVRSGADTGSTGRLASVVSSLQALGEAAARELLAADDSPAVLVLSEAGHIVQVRVPGASLVLAALFDSDENAHGALTAARETADALALVTPREAL